jgi:hypothetical protein
MPNVHITLAEIKEAHHKAAQLVMIDHTYLPLFDRLEREIADHEKANRAPLKIALTLVLRYD